jgi:hypothetical protein
MEEDKAMEPHTHPDYEQTFSKIATVLERVTEVLEAQARRGLETDERIDKLAAHVETIDIKLNEATDKLNGVIDLMDRQQRERGNN